MPLRGGTQGWTDIMRLGQHGRDGTIGATQLFISDNIQRRISASSSPGREPYESDGDG